MASPNARTKKIIQTFLDYLQSKIAVEKVYLFGSFASGRTKEFSDIDLAIISKDFKKMEPFDRLVFLGKIAWQAGTPIIEALGYTPEEFKSNSPLEFPSEIKKTGISLKIKRVA
ncbi:MAG: nucleotidyltransferase domain-containing protein [Candidatus Margulisbacteria bacterium]|nr:nucleotidyltransferase domain-containing protein [Candidatus Margulisiibacteriota bacterium]